MLGGLSAALEFPSVEREDSGELALRDRVFHA